jgi:acetyl esterase/lipase
MRRAAVALAALVAGVALAAQGQPKLMDWPDLTARPLPEATARVAYGPDPLQVAEVWRPDGKGPFPTVLMIHGGCWRSGLASLHIMDYAAEDLRRRGIGVWNIEYRGVDRPGGGYPGTFQDVSAAADALLAHGREYGLSTRRLVVLGHSAGGQLAPWLAARARIPAASPLHDATPLRIAGVVSLGGLPDLATAKAGCGEKTVARLLGDPARPDPLADTSPAALLPLSVRQVLIHGEWDDTAPPSLGRAYADKARAAGDAVRFQVVPGIGHVEEIAPGTAGWDAAVKAVQTLIR